MPKKATTHTAGQAGKAISTTAPAKSAVATLQEPLHPVQLIPEAKIDAIRNLAAISQTTKAELAACQDEMITPFIISNAMQCIEQTLRENTALFNDINGLRGKPQGFLCDRPGRRYNKQKKEWEDVPDYNKDQLISMFTQALVLGLRLNGNEFNLIMQQVMIVKNGIIRLVNSFPGVSDVEADPGIAKSIPGQQGWARAEFKASWKFNGEPKKLILEGDYGLLLKDDNMGLNALKGKAICQGYKRIYERLTNAAAGFIVESEEPSNILEPTEPTRIADERPAGAPSIMEEYQGEIGACEVLADFKSTKEAITTSKQLTDEQKLQLCELLDQKWRAVERRKQQEKSKEQKS